MYSQRRVGWPRYLRMILTDTLVFEISFFVAYYLRHFSINLYQIELYRNAALLLLLVPLFFAAFFNGYETFFKRGYYLEFLSSLLLASFGTGIMLIYLFLFQMTGDFSRITLGLFGVISTGLLYAEHIMLKVALRDRQATNTQKRSLLLVTDSLEQAQDFSKTILQDPLLGYELLGRVYLGSEDSSSSEQKDTVLCDYESLPSYLQKNWVDEVMILLGAGRAVPEELLDLCAEMGITTHLQIAAGSQRSCQQAVEKIGEYTFLTESVRMASFTERFVKRTIDIVGAVVGILITGVLFVLISPFIFLSDPGPIFFRQVRIGENGRKFKLYKFRSMYKDAEKRKAELMEKNQMTGNMFKMDNDPRILGSGPDGTKHGIGWFIRKTSIDEFPQFWNVLRGDMSLVGTRPPTVDEWEKYEAHHRARLSIRPGITGLWQVSGRSNITDFEEVIALDMEYINNWNIGMDLKIILKTVLILFNGNGAK